jgi:hypothetical protein
MVVARLLVVVAPMLVAVPAYAQRETEGQKHALAQFSDELATCYAYCQVISRCFGGSKSAHNPENLAVSQQYAVRAKTLRRLAFLFSESAGRADDATSAFIDRVMHNVMLRIRGNCANVVGIVNENGEECRQLAEHPDDRLEKLVDQNP